MAPVLTPEQLTGQADDHLVRWSADAPNPRLHPAAADALRAMALAAATDGLQLTIASGFRDYQRQALIWNGKWDGSRPLADGPLPTDEHQRLHAILRWSALPGSSRHHWGSDLDLFAANLVPAGTSLQLEPWEYQPGGHQYPLWQWLEQHAPRFGFFWPYDCDRGGVAAEPWHLSYGEIARPALTALTPACVAAALERQPLLGHTTIVDALPELLARYCYNINPEGR